MGCQWVSLSFATTWKDWTKNRDTSAFLALPIILCWGIWIACNRAIFFNSSSYPEKVVADGLAIFSHLLQSRFSLNGRPVCIESPVITKPWGYFYGSYQGKVPLCGNGFVLHLAENHSFHEKMGVGRVTNNSAEVTASPALITFAVEKGVSHLQCFGVSLIVVNWLNMTQSCRKIMLVHIVEDIQHIKHFFTSFTCCHVFMERNGVAEGLSKEGLLMDPELWMVTEFQGEDHYQFFHRPYMDRKKGTTETVHNGGGSAAPRKVFLLFDVKDIKSKESISKIQLLSQLQKWS